MKKLSLDQLEVENFASQLSEEELSNVKGGTTPACALYGAAAAVATAAIYAATEIYKAYEDDNDEPRIKHEIKVNYKTPSGADSTVTTYIYYDN